MKNFEEMKEFVSQSSCLEIDNRCFMRNYELDGRWQSKEAIDYSSEIGVNGYASYDDEQMARKASNLLGFTHQVNQHILANGSWFYTITEYGDNTSKINIEDDECPFYGDNEVTKENFCICCGNEKSCEEFVAWEEYGMFLER